MHASNLKSVQYSADAAFAGNRYRSYLLVKFESVGGTVSVGSGGSPMAFPIGGFFEPLIAHTGQFAVTGTDYVVVTNTDEVTS